MHQILGIEGISDNVSVQHESYCAKTENNEQHHYETNTMWKRVKKTIHLLITIFKTIDIYSLGGILSLTLYANTVPFTRTEIVQAYETRKI